MAIRDSVDLNQDHAAQAEALRAVLADQRAAAELHGVLDSEPGYHPGLHARLAGDLRLSGWTIPPEFGGLGRSQVEACSIHTELGRVLYPGPFLPSAVAAGALLATGHRESCERWLPLLAAGSVTATVAAADEAGRWVPGPGSVRAHYGTGGWRLSGRRWYVVAAHTAGLMVVPAVTESGGLGLFLAETAAPSLVVTRQLDLDLTRRISIVTFEAAPAVLITKDGACALARAEREFLIATAAEAAGGISWCLDAIMAAVRRQGQAGSFGEAAQFYVDMLNDLEHVSAAARYAAVVTDAGSAEAATAARVAALQAGGSYRRVISGAMNFIAERDAQLYYRRAWSAERLAGGPQAHRDALAAQLAESQSAVAVFPYDSCGRSVTICDIPRGTGEGCRSRGHRDLRPAARRRSARVRGHHRGPMQINPVTESQLCWQATGNGAPIVLAACDRGLLQRVRDYRQRGVGPDRLRRGHGLRPAAQPGCHRLARGRRRVRIPLRPRGTDLHGNPSARHLGPHRHLRAPTPRRRARRLLHGVRPSGSTGYLPAVRHRAHHRVGQGSAGAPAPATGGGARPLSVPVLVLIVGILLLGGSGPATARAPPAPCLRPPAPTPPRLHAHDRLHVPDRPPSCLPRTPASVEPGTARRA